MAERLFYLRGEIDMATAPALEASLDDAVASGDANLVVDCCDLAFIDSSGISILVDTQRELQMEGRALRVVNANPTTARLLDVMGLVEFLRVDMKTASMWLEHPGGRSMSPDWRSFSDLKLVEQSCPPPTTGEGRMNGDGELSARVAQAQGMVSVQVDCPLNAALLLMRARAASNDLSLGDVADAILDGSTRFDD